MAAEGWRTEETTALLDAVLRLQTLDEAERFFRDLCTLGELRDMAQRWAVARMLNEGLHYAQISQETGASTATITRIASWLRHGEGGYRLMLDRLASGSGEPARGAREGRAARGTPDTPGARGKPSTAAARSDVRR
jgi:TrpR-related protein YerC/YecD